MNHSYDTLAHVAYATARRIDPVDSHPAVTKADAAQVARECTTFLDACAAEAWALRWFPQTPIEERRRSNIPAQILDCLREHGPGTSYDIMPRIGHERSATEKALRKLLESGHVVIVGTLPRMGRPRIYGLPEEEHHERAPHNP